MYYSKLLIITIIFIKLNNAEEVWGHSNIDIFNFVSYHDIKRKLDKPKENLNVRECFSDSDYPTNKITCNCVTNYPKKVDLVVSHDEKWWVKSKEHFPCIDANASSPVDIKLHFEDISKNKETMQIKNNKKETTASNIIVSETCFKPREQLEFFHSCTGGTYPRSNTTCFCTFNFPQTVDLVCHRKVWYLINLPSNCKGKTSENKTHVDLGNFKGVNPDDNCLKPEELVNIFHSCEDKIYPSRTTSCNCTFNYLDKINLRCYNDESKGLIWFRNDTETPCKYNLNLRTVHCYSENGQIICACRRNCLPVNVKGNLSYFEIDNICNSNISQISNLNILMQYNDAEKSIEYSCTEGLKLIGNQKLTCNYGILNGPIPHCCNKGNKVENLSDNNNEYLTTLVLVLMLIILVIDEIILTVIIAHLFKGLRKHNQFLKTNLNEEIHSNEIRTSEL